MNLGTDFCSLLQVLPQAGAQELYDSEAGATYSYDSSSRTMISYDTVDMAKEKVGYIQQKALGGAMWWESSADKTGNQSIISNVSYVARGGCEVCFADERVCRFTRVCRVLMAGWRRSATTTWCIRIRSTITLRMACRVSRGDCRWRSVGVDGTGLFRSLREDLGGLDGVVWFASQMLGGLARAVVLTRSSRTRIYTQLSHSLIGTESHVCFFKPTVARKVSCG